MEKTFKLAALSLLSLASMASAASKKDDCAPTPGAPCYTVDEPLCQYCLGPEQVNPAVRPLTCNGDWAVTIAGFYWDSHQDGMEYAVETAVVFPGETPTTDEIQQLNNLINADYKTPNFKWNWGFKLGLGYNFSLDGWDLGVLWTSYRGRASSHNETERDDNSALVTLWSAFQNYMDSVTYASDIQTSWRLKLDLVDIEMGREFWTSKYMTFRPHIGLRIAYIDQDFDLEHRGGSWSAIGTSNQDAFNNFVELDNDYHGVGLRAGFDTTWYLGRGWSIIGNTALSIIYGKFKVKHDEYNRRAESSHDKTQLLETEESFRASRFITDLILGVQWATMFNECRYGFAISLAYEQHIFLNQNQLWRVNRVGGSSGIPLPNNTGENVYHQRRGDLDTQGFTLTVKFAF